MCIEDAMVMIELLSDSAVAKDGKQAIAAAFQSVSDIRKELVNSLVQSSRRCGWL